MGCGCRACLLPFCPLPSEAGVGWGRHWHATQKEADEMGVLGPHTRWASDQTLVLAPTSGCPSPLTLSVQRMTVEGLWVPQKGDVGKFRMVGVSKVPEAKRPLALKRLTPSLNSQNSAVWTCPEFCLFPCQ